MDDNNPARSPQTVGERRVVLTFNPSGNSEVNDLKRAVADLIDGLNEIAEQRDHPGARWAALGMTALEEGAMWGVKALTARP